jgi:cytochrome c oxidase cbb3-type subunit I/II
MAFGLFYWLVPRMYGTPLHSRKAADAHFWMATVGIVFYVVAMWVSGVTQGLMWRAVDDAGNLVYPNFLDTVISLRPFYWIRLVGGLLYLSGVVLMAVNFLLTIRSSVAIAASAAPQPAK